MVCFWYNQNMESFILIAAFMFGTIIGSFLNVVILRFRTKETLGGRSRCFSCGKELSWYELVPILSFLYQGGRCRTCGSHISWQYPIVEAVTGFMAVGAVIAFYSRLPLYDAALNFGFFFLLGCVGIILAVYDFKHMILPDEFVWLFNAVAVTSLVPPLATRITADGSFVAGIAFFAFFASLWFVSGGRWMGLGDAKLSLGIGWFLGWSGGGMALLVAFSTGAMVGVLLIAASKFRALFLPERYATLKSEIPFGPFMLLGVFIIALSGIDFMTLTSFFIVEGIPILWKF
ncbi:MAG: prepilin peptidase [Candidatus Lloydbacteria bacterium CG22_combo_CG10-13_8_21_14_all_47_15]|uniref:Prepilin peptidase n=1 Tax=Candidatus Lloydbacteria bacterium CG22_combo_CG10-13_8_21_14_all_47_15 TaxID=1974635 RepID=A0A2H0CVP4_9BACT|nr:MAG: prepilin peptidase [Candidatus Lloydbacteria bacterium CG22_combo_CG10-13_8_21_14_all_47_15]